MQSPFSHSPLPPVLFSRERRRQRMRAFLATFDRKPPAWQLPATPDFTADPAEAQRAAMSKRQHHQV